MAYYLRTKNFFGSGDVTDDSATPFRLLSAATTNATLVKSSPGIVTHLHVVNLNAAVRYLKLYDSNVKPVAGTGAPVHTLPIPASTTGAGFVLPLPVPLKFQAGIGFTTTTGIADNDTGAVAANEIIINGGFI